MILIFCYTYQQGTYFINQLRDANPEFRTWKRNKDFRFITLGDTPSTYLGYRCDVVFLIDWVGKIDNWRDVEEIKIRLNLGHFTDKTEEYYKIIDDFETNDKAIKHVK